MKRQFKQLHFIRWDFGATLERRRRVVETPFKGISYGRVGQVCDAAGQASGAIGHPMATSGIQSDREGIIRQRKNWRTPGAGCKGRLSSSLIPQCRQWVRGVHRNDGRPVDVMLRPRILAGSFPWRSERYCRFHVSSGARKAATGTDRLSGQLW